MVSQNIKHVLAGAAERIYCQKREIDTFRLNSNIFVFPSVFAGEGVSLAERAVAWSERLSIKEKIINSVQSEINLLVSSLYELDTPDREALNITLDNEFIEKATEDYLKEEEEDDDEESVPIDKFALTTDLLAYALGCILSRWDICYATGAKPIPDLPDPFAPLPVCPPGMLQNAQGLPAAPEEVPADYPLLLTWGGILVDDEGHPEDVAGRVREALAVIWGARAGDIEQEACDILGVKSLRDYFRAPAKFFAEHLKRYSKSRRQAPIYWPLGTPSGSYTLWLYYHRLSDQTLYTAVNDFVEPKLRQVEQQTTALRAHGGRDKTEEKALETLLHLEQELRDLRDELLRVAAFWKPNLNDGVVITAAPLWRLFQHKPWQKNLKATWESLEKGDYDWAHLAYSIWPERVVQAARKDRSIAIAHDLESALWVKAVDGKGKETWVEKELSEDDIQKLLKRP
ncbi:MAG: hypothetical protein IT262_18515 [Saprospiraceae bacterium]|nr:hypothetical protein [Saprospiraceae bacterium]